MLVEIAILLVFPALTIFAGTNDIFTMKVPNWIPLALVAAFACLAPFAGFGWETIGLHVAVGAAALAVGIALFAPGWIGGGDAKLFAAASLWMGPEHIYPFAMYTALAGGALTLVLLGMRKMPLPAGLSGEKWLARLHDAGRGVPYCVAITAAALLIYPHTAWMQALN